MCPPGWTRVSDAGGAVAIAIPRSWVRQLRDSGWDPAAIGLPARRRSPGLQVGAEVLSALWLCHS
jgi:hypothetical protein